MNNNHDHFGNQINQINGYVHPSDTVNPMNVSNHNFSVNNNNIAGYNSINNTNNARQNPANHNLDNHSGIINNSFVDHNTLYNTVDNSINNMNNARQNPTSNNIASGDLANHLGIINNRFVGHNHNTLHNTFDNNFYGQNSVNNSNNNLGAQTNNYTQDQLIFIAIQLQNIVDQFDNPADENLSSENHWT
ncbi:13246_t:CDS:2 [Entrophospora sp. SA101]|nr:13246_t:CDS:2 [Entrophospora sp. SA101]